MPYDVAATADYQNGGNCGPGALNCWGAMHLAADIGIYWAFSARSGGHGEHPANTRTTERLSYAVVGGVTYGTPVVAGEDGVPARSGLRASVYPNPAQGARRLSVTGASGPLSVEVFDVTGRSVQRLAVAATSAGQAEVPLDLGGLPRGVYLLTVRDGAGAVASARAVVL